MELINKTNNSNHIFIMLCVLSESSTWVYNLPVILETGNSGGLPTEVFLYVTFNGMEKAVLPVNET